MTSLPDIDFASMPLNEIIDFVQKNFTPQEVDEFLANSEKYNQISAENPLRIYKPTTAQAPFHNSIKKIRLVSGGNGAGKTVCGGKEAACYLLGEDPSGTTTKRYRKPPIRMWVGSPDFKTGLNVTLAELFKWLPRESIKYFHKQENTIHLHNGSSASLKSYESDPSKWQSEALDAAWLDEQIPYQHYRELLSRINRREGDIWITMTPIYANSSWTATDLYENPQGDPEIEVFKMHLDTNIFLSGAIRERQKFTYLGSVEEACRIAGEPITLQGLLFPKFKPYVNIKPQFKDDDLKKLMGRNFKFARVIDSHPRNADVCSWFVYSWDHKLAYNFDECVAYNMSAHESAAYFLSFYPFLDYELDILDTPETDSELQLGTTSRNEYAIAGLPCSKPFKNIPMSIIQMNSYFGADPPGLYITENCRNNIVAMKTALWDDWKGPRKFEGSPKEKMKDFPLIHQVNTFQYFMITMPSLKFQNQAYDDPNERAAEYRRFDTMRSRYRALRNQGALENTANAM